MQNPLVSVHMITYNHALYIRKAIECVLAQKTDFPFELVIGEDCSTDGTRDIVFDYAKRYPDIIRVVATEQNVGMKRNAYRTFQACRGKYIAYCEGDDYWHHPEKLQKQADYLEKHPECGLVHSDQDRYYVESGKTIKRFFYTTGNTPPQNIPLFRGWGAYHILTCTVMARKQLAETILSDPVIYQNDKHIGGTDIPLFIEIGMASKIYYIDESLATYTVQMESASNMKNPGRKARFVRSNVEAYLYLAEKYCVEEEAAILRQRLHRSNLWAAFWDRDIQLAHRFRAENGMHSVKSWLLYVGAINDVMYFVLRSYFILSAKLKNKYESRKISRYAV